MPRKAITAQPTYTLLVGHLSGGSDPSRGVAGNPDVIRETITYQYFPELGARGHDSVLTDPKPAPGTDTKLGILDGLPETALVSIEVIDNDFAAPATILLGSHKITSGIDYVVGGSLAATATAIAAAIDGLPGFEAAPPAGTSVSISGPPGPGGNEVVFDVLYDGAIENFTMNPPDGSLTNAEPIIGPPIIT
jgi:hypothetical protein